MNLDSDSPKLREKTSQFPYIFSSAKISAHETEWLIIKLKGSIALFPICRKDIKKNVLLKGLVILIVYTKIELDNS